MRPFSINDNKNKKVITTTNNNQCKSIKKEKIKLLKNCLLLTIIKIKLMMRKQKSKNIFSKMPVNTKTVIDEKKTNLNIKK